MENGPDQITESVHYAHIIVTIETEAPIEISDFTDAFTSIANQYRKYLQENYPLFAGESEIFVNEVNKGSIIIDLIPIIQGFVGLTDSAKIVMQQADSIVDFVTKYGAKIKTYFANDRKVDSATSSDLKDFMGTLAAIANDPNGRSTVKAAIFEKGQYDIRAALSFTTKEARQARENINAHKNLIEISSHVTHRRVLMVFVQSNIKTAPKDRRSGERVIIQEISKNDRPIFYASELAEERIKHEIRESDENVFKKGFIVDVFAETRNERVVAYKIIELHDVIDISDE